MARKKHHKKARATRRRSHSRVGAVDFTHIIAAVAGGLGAKLIDKVLPATLSPKMMAGAKIAVGLALPMIAKSGQAKNVASAVGTGFLVVGSLDLLKSFGVLNGLGITDEPIYVSLDGTDEVNTVNGNDGFTMRGIDEVNTVNGLEDVNDM